MWKRVLIGGLAAACLALPVLAVAAPGIRGARFAQSTADGHNAQAVAIGKTKSPMAIYLRVTSRPAQPLTGFWSVDCTRAKGSGHFTTRRNFSGRSPQVRRLKLPFPRPVSCRAIVSAGITTSPGGASRASGFLKAQLFAAH
ncbi:MAG TPA: hypothetical protein VJL81_17045 [Solirubrobacterales bacterium]|nr:hypothetical protein [Solirubrobacterales bacterium]